MLFDDYLALGRSGSVEGLLERQTCLRCQVFLYILGIMQQWMLLLEGQHGSSACVWKKNLLVNP